MQQDIEIVVKTAYPHRFVPGQGIYDENGFAIGMVTTKEND